MDSVEEDRWEPQLSVGWQEDTPEQGDQSVERAATYIAALARTLAAAGYWPRHLDVGLRHGAPGVLQLHVRGDIPRISEADFESVAQMTLNSVSVRLGFADDCDLQLWAHLEDVHPSTEVSRHPIIRLPFGTPLTKVAVGRVVAGVVVGCLLGVIGLPRLDLPFSNPFRTVEGSSVSPAVPAASVAQVEIEPTSVAAESTSTSVAVQPTPTAAPAPTIDPPSGARVLIDERFDAPVPSWPNDPEDTAWFADGAFRLYARQSGRFVAVGVPLPGALGDAVVSAQFRKLGGPAGGGYGLIIRDQSSASERDGHSQAGQYLVLEVGDRGDIGVWHRDETHWIDIVPWTHWDVVHLDTAPNLLSISTRGNALHFEVNGAVVADLTYDGVPPTGGVGIFVGGDLNQVALDWLRIEE